MSTKGISFIYGDDYSYRRSMYTAGRAAYPAFLGFMARASLDYSAFDRSFLWSAKAYTSALNAYTMTTNPYSYTTVFPGGRTYYTVMDSSLYSMGGYKAPSIADASREISAIVSAGSVRIASGKVGAVWHLVRSLSGFLDNEHLSDESKAEVRAYVEKAKTELEELDKLLKNEEGLSADELSELLKAELEKAEAVKAETDEKFKIWQEEVRSNEEAARARRLEERDDGGEIAGSSRRTVVASGSASGAEVTELPEDEELTAAKSKTRYGMSNEASIPACDNADDLVIRAFAEEMQTKESFLELFGKDNDINEKNIIEVLDATNKTTFVEKLITLTNGDKNYSTDALKEIVKLLKARVKLLADAGHIKKSDKELVNAHIKNLTDWASNVSVNKDDIVEALDAIVSKLKTKGTADVVTADINAKKDEARELAKKEFRKAYADDEDETYDEAKTYAAFPDEITYLPNSKLFVVKIELEGSTKYFKAGNFKNLDKVITASENEDVIEKWKGITDKLLQEESEDV